MNQLKNDQYTNFIIIFSKKQSLIIIDNEQYFIKQKYPKVITLQQYPKKITLDGINIDTQITSYLTEEIQYYHMPNLQIINQGVEVKIKTPIHLGHRGCGKNGKLFMTKVQENCLYSYKLACQHVDGIELDLICTKDNQLVINHDFSIHLDKQIHINQITKEEFQNIKFKVNTNKPENEKRCTFQEVLDTIQIDKTIDCEIKYPTIKYNQSYPSRDKIIQLVFKEIQGKQNKIIFSSFDPIICLLLKYSQNQYPVYLLHCATGMMDLDVDNTWTVPKYFNYGVIFVKEFDLNGIITRQAYVDRHQQVINQLHQMNKQIFTWGSIFQRKTRSQPDGYIHDCIVMK